MPIARVLAGAFLCCCIVVGVSARAASRVARADQTDPPSSIAQRNVDQTSVSDRFPPDWLQTIVSKRIQSVEGRFAATETVSDLLMPALADSASVLSSQTPRSHSIVPLPTGLSLFGAGLLTLGLIGFASGSSRRLAVQTGLLATPDMGPDPADTVTPIRFKIEVRSDRGCEVRHASSARGTIDLIADLLNEGWEITSIRDRQGWPLVYEDVLEAWQSERRGDRARSTPSS